MQHKHINIYEKKNHVNTCIIGSKYSNKLDHYQFLIYEVHNLKTRILRLFNNSLILIVLYLY